MNRIKPQFLSRKRAITTFLSRKSMITRSSIAFEDFVGSSIAPQVMPPWYRVNKSTSPKSTGHTFGGHCDNVVNAPIWGQRLIWRWGGHTFWKCHWRGSMMLCLVQRFCLYHGLGAYSKSDYLVDFSQIRSTWAVDNPRFPGIGAEV